MWAYKIPEGWTAVWIPEHECLYYVNEHNRSQCEPPAEIFCAPAAIADATVGTGTLAQQGQAMAAAGPSGEAQRKIAPPRSRRAMVEGAAQPATEAQGHMKCRFLANINWHLKLWL